jgi:FMN phosphatase YigB (HAD superfamily)
VVHVGDLKHTDVLGAKQAGMYSVRYSGVRDDIGEGFPEADWVITDYRDLTEIIRGIR